MASKDELSGATAGSPPPTEEPQQQQQHECTIGVYSTTNMAQQPKNYYFVSRLNQEFFQCAVYDSDDPSTGRLVGVELIISDRIYHVLPPDEKKFWHSHAYEKENLWINEGVIEILQLTELQLSTSYGKFWSTWQWDNGDALPLGMPSAMKSSSPLQVVKDELMDDISSDGPNQGENWEGRKNKFRERPVQDFLYIRTTKVGHSSADVKWTESV
ncbi:Oil body-associated protein 2a [Thalictrum thalictroides]|uniref:Oil body-associated protein 2a n=1 Tax=Thalictrum thalictroides TaxID=46969 RepID=A0A7J6VQI8_THATH|nr:Oil body-associated protein 2a [Thalictrum thalictroides]